MKILLIRLSAIGDCCLVLPVVRAILEQNKKARICWLIGKAAYQLLQYSVHPRLEYKVIDKPKRLSDYLNIWKEFRDKDFDVLLAMQASTRANLIYPLIKADRKIGFDIKRAREFQWVFTNEKITFVREHLHESFCQFANKLGVATDSLNWEISIPDNDKFLEQYQFSSNFIVINPAASKLERSWSVENYVELIDWISSELGFEVILTGSNALFEIELAKNIEEKVSVAIRNLVGKTNLLELGLIIKKAHLLVAPDTGPAHIANSIGTMVIGLYAVAPAWLSAPYNYQDFVIDEHKAAVKKFLNKETEDIKWGLRVHNRAAMDLITVEQVKQKIREALNSNK